jgi:hypothetical protein
MAALLSGMGKMFPARRNVKRYLVMRTISLDQGATPIMGQGDCGAK